VSKRVKCWSEEARASSAPEVRGSRWTRRGALALSACSSGTEGSASAPRQPTGRAGRAGAISAGDQASRRADHDQGGGGKITNVAVTNASKATRSRVSCRRWADLELQRAARLRTTTRWSRTRPTPMASRPSRRARTPRSPQGTGVPGAHPGPAGRGRYLRRRQIIGVSFDQNVTDRPRPRRRWS